VFLSQGRARRLAHQSLVRPCRLSQPSREIHGAAEPIVAVEDCGARMRPDAYRQQVRPPAQLTDGPRGQHHRLRCIRRADHHAVAHELQPQRPVLVSERRDRLFEFPCHQRAGAVAELLRQRRVAHEICEHERRRVVAAEPSAPMMRSGCP